jgi:hypothetical protein
MRSDNAALSVIANKEHNRKSAGTPNVRKGTSECKDAGQGTFAEKESALCPLLAAG